MRRGTHRSVALLVASMLVVLPASSALASLTTTTSATYTVSDVDYSQVIPAGWASFSHARECVWNDCPEREGVAFTNVDISSEMQNYEDYAKFYLVDGWTSLLTLWMVCSYDADGVPINCWYDEQRSWGISGELSPDARELRLFPVQSGGNEYHLYVYVD